MTIFRIRETLLGLFIFRKDVLTDGSMALKKAVEENADGTQHLCFSHMIWNGHSSTGKGHGSGTKGSLICYLSDKKCSCSDISDMVAYCLAIRHLPSRKCWLVLRGMLIKHCDNAMFIEKTKKVKKEIMHNIFERYFTVELKWGYSHEPGNVHSIQG